MGLMQIPPWDVEDIMRLHGELHDRVADQLLRHRCVLAEHLLGVGQRGRRVPDRPALLAPHLHKEHILVVGVHSDGLRARGSQVDHRENMHVKPLREQPAHCEERLVATVGLIDDHRRALQVPSHEALGIKRFATPEHLQIRPAPAQDFHEVVHAECVRQEVRGLTSLGSAIVQGLLLPMPLEEIIGEQLLAEASGDSGPLRARRAVPRVDGRHRSGGRARSRRNCTVPTTSHQAVEL
mmetsp:Transcript_131006/g.379036  ORF Transcript_131006/g.379036 Transcript_131006/m.379036 type:complete len:238 (+) Transcript_131006:642-1355(+)